MVGKSENELPVAPGPPSKSVSPLNTAPSSGACQQTEPGECPGVCSARSSVPATRNVSPSPTDAEILVGMGHSPQHIIGGMQQHRGVQRITQFGRHRHMVVVAVGADHRDHVAAADGVDDRTGVVRGVENHHLVVVADDPDVVVDFPTAAIEFEGAVGNHTGDAALSSSIHFITTTERSTSPACILWNASSMSSRPMRSETNFSSGSRPCR